jgi:TolA-binding protein
MEKPKERDEEISQRKNLFKIWNGFQYLPQKYLELDEYVNTLKAQNADLKNDLKCKNDEFIQMQSQLKSLEEQNQQLSQSLQEVEAQRNSLIEQNLFLTQQINDLENRTKFLRMNDEEFRDERSKYDCIIDIKKFPDIASNGWEIEFPSLNGSTITPELYKEIGTSNLFIAVTGTYDKGKTFLLNKITKSCFPSSKKEETRGISFKSTTIKKLKLIIIDSAGSHSPIKVNESIEEKKEHEKRLRDIIFSLSNIFILVVNDYTTLDQEILEKLEKQLLINKKNKEKQIIVVHNFKDVNDEESRQIVWRKQVLGLYEESPNNPDKKIMPYQLEVLGCVVDYLQINFTRHLMIANDHSEYGREYNRPVIELIRQWITAFCNRDCQVNVFDSLLGTLKKTINYKEEDVVPESNTNNDDTFYSNRGFSVCRNQDKTKLVLKCNQQSLKSESVFPENYEPAIDFIETENEYNIIIDAPGVHSPKISMKGVYTKP